MRAVLRWLAVWLFAVAAASGVLAAPSADSAEEIFVRGNAAYETGRFDEAAEAYRTLVRYGVRDARVNYNLGNAAFKQAKLGEAIFHYLVAYRMDPTDPDIQANLDLARSRCFDRVETPEMSRIVRFARSVQDRLGPDRQAVACLVLLWLAAAIVAWRSSRPGGWNATAGWILAGLVLLLAISCASWSATYTRLEGRQLAVVLSPSVEALAGPGQNNAALFTVHEGLTLDVRSERQDWIQISLPNGLNGWVPRDAVGIL